MAVRVLNFELPLWGLVTFDLLGLAPVQVLLYGLGFGVWGMGFGV